jgi:hypothetical protein
VEEVHSGNIGESDTAPHREGDGRHCAKRVVPYQLAGVPQRQGRGGAFVFSGRSPALGLERNL